MTAQTNTNGTNLKFADVTDFMKEVVKLGEKEATGLVQRAEFAVNVAIAANEGHINKEDAAEIWTKYRSKHASKLGANVKDVEKSAKVRISETKAIIIAGALPNADFASTLERSRSIIATADFVKGNSWDNMVKLARFQAKSENAERILSDRDIETALTPDAAKTKDEAAMLKAVAKSMERIMKGSEGTDTSDGKPAYPSAELEDALNLINQRLAVLELGIKTSELRALQVKAGL